jgi:hypothetical protein
MTRNIVLIVALERREMDLRVRACELLKQMLGGSVDFDSYAAEEIRRRQIAALRARVSGHRGVTN